MTLPGWVVGASVAPSAHNTQPWHFTVLPDDRIQVGWTPTRTLPIGDPTSRDLFLALGAAVESACLRALTDGKPLRFEPAPDDAEGVVGWLTPLTLTPALSQRERESTADLTLARALNRRQTARGPHLPRAIPFNVQQEFADETQRHGRRLLIVTDRPIIQHLARLAGQATATLFADDAVHTELWRWLRLDPRDPAYRRDGLTADCLDLAGPTRWLAQHTMPPARMRWLVRVGLHQLFASDTERVARQSAAICLLTTPSLDRVDLVETGRVLQRLWLLAATRDLTTHPLSALLDCAATIGPAVAAFAARGANPAAIFRLGATGPAARAPRLPLAEIITVASQLPGAPSQRL